MRTFPCSLGVAAVFLLLSPALVCAQNSTDALSYHAGTLTSVGVNATEQQLTSTSISNGAFGKLFTTDITDVPNTTGIPASTLPSGINYSAPAGQVYAEPLVKTGVNITTGNFQGVHDVVFVATSMDSLFAIDANGGTVLWKDSFLYNAAGNPNPLNATIPTGVTACPGGFGTEINSQDLSPWIGIVDTPVIDGVNGYLYLVAKTREVHSGDQTHPHYVLTLHKVRLADGLDASAVIADTTLQTSDTTFTYNSGPYVLGTGESTVTVGGQNRIYVNALRQMTRPALELYNGRIYIGSGSHGDNQPYHGWLLTYDAATLACNGAWNATPNTAEGEGGIWQGGAGVVIDSNGYIYFEVGNGAFDGTISNGVVSGLDGNGFPASGDYGDCFVKLALDPTTTQGNQGTNKNGWGLKVVDYFSPYNNKALDTTDTDIGSGGPVILPDAVGSTAHPHLLVGGGKGGKFYLIDRDNMGKFGTTDNVVQTFNPASNACFCVPSYFNGRLYTTTSGGFLYSWPLAGAVVNTGAQQSSGDQIAFPGCSPFISANGTANGIVWVVDKGTGQLRAYDASNLATELWTSNQNATSDALGSAVKFSVPTVVNGHVYVGTADHLVAYGPPVPPTAPPAAPTALNAAATGPSTVMLAWTDNSNNENSFRIARSGDGANFTEVGTAGVNQTSYGDSGLAAQTTYYYRVRAANLYNGASYSAYTNTASATTPAVGSQSAVNVYHFDEGTGTATADSVSGNNGTLVGTPLPTWASPGQVGSSSLSFTGSGTYNQTGGATAFVFGFDTAGASATGWKFGGNSGSGASDGSPNGVSFYALGSSSAAVAAGTAALGSTPLGVGTYDLEFVAAQTTGTSSDLRITVTDSLGKAVFSTTTKDYTLSSPAKTWTQYDFPFSVTSAPANDYLVVSFSSDAKASQYFGWDTITGTYTATNQSAVQVANDLSPVLGSTSSLLCWIKTRQTGNDTHWQAPAITGVEQAANSNDINWGYLNSAGHIGVAVGDSGSILSTVAVNDGTWHHVGLSRDASTGVVKVYVDGVLNASGTLETGSKTSSFRLLGALSDVMSDGVTFTGGNYFNGQLDDVQIYNLTVDPAVVSSFALPPAAPTQLTLTPASGTELDLVWMDNANDESGYEVWRSISGGAAVRIAQLPANSTAYMDTGLTQGTGYGYFVRAIDPAGSADSNVVNTATPTPPQTPSGAAVTFLSSNEVDMQWNDNSNNETGFKILRRINNANFAQIATLPANTTQYKDTTVQPGIYYEYHIQAYNIAGYSDFTGVNVTTPTLYQSYLATYFTTQQLGDPTITGPLADPDHDGICNLLEYAFGMDPTRADVSRLPKASVQGGYLTISFIQRTAATDLTYTVEVSGDMNNWYSGSGYTTGVSTTALDPADQQVVVRDNTPVEAGGRRFIRVRVSQQ